MKREEFEHTVRAAGAVLGLDEVLVIGSQALRASIHGVVAWCLEAHDLWIPKAISGRPKDIEFCAALARLGIVDPKTLEARIVSIRDLDPRVRHAVEGRITSL